MPRSEQGLSAAGEWPALKALLPELAGKRVLDLGCGFGWHCRYAAEHGAARVLGTDLSQRMLERARAMTDSPVVEYRRAAIEDMRPAPAAWDVVLSSLALHYVEDYAGVCRMVWDALSPGGWFIFSAEHPVFTAQGPQDWQRDAGGAPLHWPVDRYFEQGPRGRGVFRRAYAQIPPHRYGLCAAASGAWLRAGGAGGAAACAGDAGRRARYGRRAAAADDAHSQSAQAAAERTRTGISHLPVVSLLKKNMRRPGSGRRIFISLSVPPPARAVPRGRRWASAPLFS